MNAGSLDMRCDADEKLTPNTKSCIVKDCKYLYLFYSFIASLKLIQRNVAHLGWLYAELAK